MLRHLDLFSGIGGFAVAAQWAGFKTVAFCEVDPRCRAFLEATWGIPVEPDIRKLAGRRYAGISLLTGGPPCQPASRAGKQRGASDDRWLWGEALRVLEEAKPDCVVFENPPGIEDVGLDGILSEMERIGYEVQPFDIPACAVDSPQLRHRYWIIGFLANTSVSRLEEPAGESSYNGSKRSPVKRSPLHSDMANGERSGGEDEIPLRPRRPRKGEINDSRNGSDMADSKRERRQRRRAITGEEEGGRTQPATSGLHWQNHVWVPCADRKFRRAPDESVDVVNGLHRSILAALGNSICPQVAFEILSAARSVLTS